MNITYVVSRCDAARVSPPDPDVVGQCAGCGIEIESYETVYDTERGLLHADLTCALRALCGGDAPVPGPARELLAAR